MKPYHLILGLVIVCALVGMQTTAGTTSMDLAAFELGRMPLHLSDIAEFGIAEAWTNTTGAQVIDLVVDNFDADANDEVAVLTANGTLYLFDDNGTLLWQADLGITPHMLVPIAVDAGTTMELLVGTTEGFKVIAANQTVLVDVILGNDVRAVVAADLDGDGEDEVVVGCDDNRVYAYETNSVQLWNYTSNGRVRAVAAGDVLGGAADEVLAGSENGRFTFLNSIGTVAFEKLASSAVRVLGVGDLAGTVAQEVVFGTALGNVYVYYNDSTLAYSLSVDGAITALEVNALVAGAKEELAVGTSLNELRIYNSSGALQWNYAMGGPVAEVHFLDVGGTVDNQVLVSYQGGIALYNSTGHEVVQTSLVGYSGAADF